MNRRKPTYPREDLPAQLMGDRQLCQLKGDVPRVTHHFASILIGFSRDVVDGTCRSQLPSNMHC